MTICVRTQAKYHTDAHTHDSGTSYISVRPKRDVPPSGAATVRLRTAPAALRTTLNTELYTRRHGAWSNGRASVYQLPAEPWSYMSCRLAASADQHTRPAVLLSIVGQLPYQKHDGLLQLTTLVVGDEHHQLGGGGGGPQQGSGEPRPHPRRRKILASRTESGPRCSGTGGGVKVRASSLYWERPGGIVRRTSVQVED